MRRNHFNRISYRNRNINKVKVELCSSVLLDTAKNSFEHEYDRAKRIESKANMILVLSGVIFTVLIAYLKIDLDTIKINYIKIAIRLIYVFSIIFYALGFKSLMNVLTIKGYEVLDYNKVFNEENFECEKRDVEESLIKSYKKMINAMERYNKNKIKFYKKGLNYVYKSQVLILFLCIINFFI